MITGFLTFVLWLLIINKLFVERIEKNPPKTFIQKAIVVLTPILLGGFLIWMYCVHWDILATFLAIAFFAVLLIRGLFGF